ncbi:MAG: amidohydrolase family protein, partial [Candidatus Thermoplasmatota archaeon]|nr:amidohydrolase family protein [Candidatus Thermoplasmatota archaeon]
RSTEKVFSLHASEAKREDFQKILELKPDLLVHMVHASDDDMESCASAGIPVVICPGSNAYFGLKPPLRKMLDAGITVCLGSDNAMLSEPNMLEELRKLRTMFPITEITDREMLEILFINCRKVLNSLPGLGAANSNQPDFFVLEAPVDEPFLSIMGSETENIRMFDMGGIP